MRVASHVLAMAWLSAEEQQLDLQGRSLLAVLHEITGVSCRGQQACLLALCDPN